MGSVNRSNFNKAWLLKGFAGIIVLLLLTLAFLYRHDYKEIYLLRINPLEDQSINLDSISQSLKDSRIWMLGDSRIQMWDESLLVEDGSIINLGIDGQTSEQVFYRLKSYLEIDTPDVLVLQVGINELKIIGLNRNLAPAIVNNLQENIMGILEVCDKYRIKVILTNVFPVGNIELGRRFVWNKAVNENIILVNKTLHSYSDGLNVIYYDAFNALSSDGETVNTEFQQDFLHINKNGYKLLSEGLKEQIVSILKSKE